MKYLIIRLLGLISVLLIEAIYFYNFTTPEFNVNVCQLPFWSLTVYYSWKIYSGKEIKVLDCFLVGSICCFWFFIKISFYLSFVSQLTFYLFI